MPVTRSWRIVVSHLGLWALVLGGGPRSAYGQEVVLNGPLAAPRPVYWVGAVPARFEWSYWVSGGIGATRSRHGSNAGGQGAIGGELTLQALRYHGFPSGPCYAREKGDAEIRLGPWVSGATREAGGLVEGGLKAHLGGIYHASFGTWDVRGGAGYGAFADGLDPHATATLAYGARSALARYPRTRRQAYSEQPPEPRSFAEASIARIFITYRYALDRDNLREIMVGVELSPTFLLPPYSLFRFGGGPPW